MSPLGLILIFIAGALLCNSIPHVANGVCGQAFPTPFARPPGVGLSSPVVNFLWGSANLFVGLILLLPREELAMTWPGRAAFALGFVVLGAFLAKHFGKVIKTT